MAFKVANIGLADSELDCPIYRIYPIWFFEQALMINGGNLALVRPTMWEDPHEDPCALIQMSAPNGARKQLSGYLQPTFAQCWSMEGGSDALLRAYSRVSRDRVLERNTEPKFEGVKVRTTARLIMTALEQYLEKRNDSYYSFWLAKVEYVDNVFQPVVDRLAEIGPMRLGSGFDRVRSLTFKRKAFEHEQELRIIALTPFGAKQDIALADVNPNVVFQEVWFDPRLVEFERLEREGRIRALGYAGAVTVDTSYYKTLVDVPLPKHWDELDAPAAHATANST